MNDKADTTAVEDMSFEDAMRALEGVVDALDKPDVGLERSLELYERGNRLKAHCEKKLRDAEEKVAKITTDAQGEPKGTEPFDAG